MIHKKSLENNLQALSISLCFLPAPEILQPRRSHVILRSPCFSFFLGKSRLIFVSTHALNNPKRTVQPAGDNR